MYAARFVTRTLPRCTPHLNHILRQRSLLKTTREMPMICTFRYLGAKDGGKPPAGAGKPPPSAAKPPAGHGKPPAAAGKPPADAGKPPASDAGKPPAAAGKPPPADGKPPAAPGGGGEVGEGAAAVAEVPVPAVILKIIKPRIIPELGYDDRNMRLGRVMSPHLTIYKMQVTSVLSIMLRMTGFALTIFVWALGVTGLFAKRSLCEMAQDWKDCDVSRHVVSAVKFLLVFPFAYHVVAATRHLLWHFNIFLSKPEIYATGYAAVALTFVLAAGMTVLNIGDGAKKDVVDMSEPCRKKTKKEKEKEKEEAKKASK